jgi:hypothetical protein
MDMNPFHVAEAGAPDPEDVARARRDRTNLLARERRARDKVAAFDEDHIKLILSLQAEDAKETERLRKLKKSESGKRSRARINAALDALPAASGAAAPAPPSRFSGAAAREPQGGALGSWPGRALAIRSAREPEADTLDKHVGMGVPSRYHVSSIIVTGPRRPALPHTGLHTQEYTVPAKRALLENTLREFEQAFDRRCATSRDQSSFDVRASGAGRAAGGSGRRVLEGGAGGAARYERASFEKMMEDLARV